MGRPRFLRSVGSDRKATSIDTKARSDTDGNSVPTAAQGQIKGKPESELRAAAWRHGLNLKELADRMGVNYGYLSPVASGVPPLDSHAAGRGHGGAGPGRPARASSTGRPA